MSIIRKLILYFTSMLILFQFYSCHRKTVNKYLGCYHCEITDSDFENIRNVNTYQFHNHKKLTTTEYARTVLRSSYEYDNFIKSGKLISPNDPSTISKSEYIDLQIDVFEKIKIKKLDKWYKFLSDPPEKPSKFKERLINIYLKLWL